VVTLIHILTHTAHRDECYQDLEIQFKLFNFLKYNVFTDAMMPNEN